MRKRSIKQLTDNQGFSLMEVIISIALIGIVFVSLMQYFSSSIQANNYAKDVQKASLAAQTVMEEIDGITSIEEIAKAYNGTTNPDWEEVEPDGSGGFKIKSTKSHSGSTFTPSETYYFTKKVTVDGTKYKAIITVDSKEYNIITDKYNDLPLPSIHGINSDSSAIIVDKSQDNEAIEEFVSKDIAYVADQLSKGNSESLLSKEFIINNMKRELRVNITDSGDGLTGIQVHYRYKCGAASHLTPIDKTPLLDKYFANNKFGAIYYFFNKFKNNDYIYINDLRSTTTKKQYDFYVVCQNPDASIKAILSDDIGPIAKTFSNIIVQKGVSINSSMDLVEKGTRQRYADVTVQIMDDSTNEVIAEIKTMRGE